MKDFFLTKLIPAILIVISAALLYAWVSYDPALLITQRLPGGDNAPSDSTVSEKSGDLTGKLISFDGTPSNLTGSWPFFRGPDSTGISYEQTTLSETWPTQGPKVLWSIDLGEGYAGPAVLNGSVYLLDYDQQNEADTIRCLSLDDGKELWRYSYPIKIKRNHGMSRTVPAVTDKYIVTLGPKCHVTCLDSITGRFLWMIDLVADFKTEVPLWYAGQCPLIENGKAIIAPGGKALIMAVDCQTGQIAWQTPNPDKWQMTHSSPMPMEFKGRRFYVYCGSGGVAGISAKDGSVLWKTEEWKMRTNVPSPVIINDNLIFLSAGYNQGCMMLELNLDNDQIKLKIRFRLQPEQFGADQQTPIFYKGYIYGVRPDGQLTCLDLNGNIIWTSGSASKFGLGPFIIAQDKIFIMDNSGLLTLAKAQPAKYEQLAQYKALEGPDSWGPMALASGRLLLRDLNEMICIDVSEP